MLASDVYYRARVCGGRQLGHVCTSMLRDSHHFTRVDAYYNKARYNSLITRENMTRWNITNYSKSSTPQVA